MKEAMVSEKLVGLGPELFGGAQYLLDAINAGLAERASGPAMLAGTLPDLCQIARLLPAGALEIAITRLLRWNSIAMLAGLDEESEQLALTFALACASRGRGLHQVRRHGRELLLDALAHRPLRSYPPGDTTHGSCRRFLLTRRKLRFMRALSGLLPSTG